MIYNLKRILRFILQSHLMSSDIQCVIKRLKQLAMLV